MITAKPVVKKSAVKPVEVKTEKTAVTNINDASTFNLNEDTLFALLRALYIRAQFGGEAVKTYNAVVELLMK